MLAPPYLGQPHYGAAVAHALAITSSDLDAAVTAGSPTESSSIPPQPQQQRPRQLSAVPATPQSLHPDQEPSSPTTSASRLPTFPPTLAQDRLSNTDDSLLPPLAPDTDGEPGVGPPGDGSLPAYGDIIIRVLKADYD
jgi:hypothetical protein